MYNAYRFSTATMVALTRLNVTVYVHCSVLNNYCRTLFQIPDVRSAAVDTA